MKTQSGISAHANFEEKTWTFEMESGYAVSSGQFAIIPVKDYNEALNNLETILANFPLNADIQHIKDTLVGVIKQLNP